MKILDKRLLNKYVPSLVKATLTTLVGATMFCGSGCAINSHKGKIYPMRNENIVQGNYECDVYSQKKTYSFDSQELSSNFLWETDTPGIEFKDKETKQKVRLYSGSDDYTCKRVGDVASSNENWVAVHIWDSFYPLSFYETFPETIMSLETMLYQFYHYNAVKLVENAVGADEMPLHGYREKVGHAATWLHLSDEFVRKYRSKLEEVDKKLFLFPNQKTDIFVGWEGNPNVRDFLEKGLVGLTNKAYKFDGTMEGNFHGFKEAVETGNSDFEFGFFITEQQTLKFIESIDTFSGLQNGYTLLSRIEDDSEPLFETELVQAVTGDHCIGFMVYGLANAGVVPLEVFERLKVPLYYPKEFWDKPLPINLFEISTSGIFDKEEIIDEIYNTEQKYLAVNNWNYEALIKWFEANSDFKSKRVIEDLLPAVSLGNKITDPFQYGRDRYRFRDSDKYLDYLRRGNELMKLKREKAGLVGKRKQKLIEREKILKREFEEINSKRFKRK